MWNYKKTTKEFNLMLGPFKADPRNKMLQLRHEVWKVVNRQVQQDPVLLTVRVSWKLLQGWKQKNGFSLAMISINSFLFVPIRHSIIWENLGLVLNFPEEQDVTEQCHMVETRESWSVRCGATLSVHSRWTFWWPQVLYLFSCNYTRDLIRKS